jgi:hypothetical protein
MSNIFDKFFRSRRLQQDENAIQKQLKIAKAHGLTVEDIGEPHRLAKQHAMDCGNPQCLLCSREKVFGKPTIQEQRFYQTEKTKFDTEG